ncbi:cold shock domain-containing protein [Nodularia spumigena CS-586/05]|uniref:cold shock domain-containing protein n=1 Tax=Nodularia spumigena TaxID=70799 RepID=UPI0023308800|nr:cold shock domain-containing protein [Nodularia spumigena]MDB9343858.1 cold shock domain-containing protein [Nodularia spumigena CS-588/06]MDB9370095.1 cold shock domain-containing protein [Nodularia spumigena CS-586/05]
MNKDVKKFGFMTIEVGSVKSYNGDRGFGFVGRTFSYPNEKVFFHIKKIKKKHPQLAEKLDNRETFETINFWYELETTQKGEQVTKIWLKADNIPQTYTHELYILIQGLESIWKNIDYPKPIWLDLVTIELVGADRQHELSVERDNLENQLREAEEKLRREAEALRENEIARIAKSHHLEKTKADELHQLLEKMRPLGFTHSNQLSKHIVRYQLGYKYPNISGILRMRQADREWDFHGGFPPRIYKIICEELDLDNQGTDAEPGEFTSFKDIYSANQK